MNKEKQIVCILLPVISQNEVCFLGAKNRVKSKNSSNKKTVRQLISGTVEKCENAEIAAKRIIYDKFDIILDRSVKTSVFQSNPNNSPNSDNISYVFIDKLLDFEQFPLVHIAHDVQELILVNEHTQLTSVEQQEFIKSFVLKADIDNKLADWEENLQTTLA